MRAPDSQSAARPLLISASGDSQALLIQSGDSLVKQGLTKRTRTARSCRPVVTSRGVGCSSLSEFVRPSSLLNDQQWRRPMPPEEFRAKWSTRRVEWEKLGVWVRGATSGEPFIAPFEYVLT